MLGVVENFGKANPRTIPVIERIDVAVEKMAGGTDSVTAVGGMKSKIEAAKIVVRSGIPMVIANELTGDGGTVFDAIGFKFGYMVERLTRGDRLDIAFATVYPTTTILKILCAQVAMSLLGGP